MTPEELRDAGVRIAGLVLVDNAGLARLKCVPIDRLARAAERGITIRALVPSLREPQATPWAWFPALAAMTPFFLSAALSCEMQ